MDKINFQNLPSTTTPVNATNLNQLQTNVENTLNTYSTSEMRIGTWIGKPLYRKVINFGALPDTDSKSVAHNILNLNKIVSLHGYSFSTSSYIPIPYAASNTSTSAVVLLATPTDIVIYTYQNQSPFAETYIVVEYTKTTD